jgi:hypothetical protein
MADKKVFTPEQIEIISNYMKSRLGLSIKYHETKTINRGKLTYIESDPIKRGDAYFGSVLGPLFCHVIKEVTVVLNCYRSEDDKGKVTYVISPKLSYTHPSGGSNGCDMDIHIEFNPDTGWLAERYHH